MNWIKQPTRAGFWAWRYGPDAAGCTAHSLFEHEGKLRAYDDAGLGPCEEWGGEWAELVPAEDIAKSQAQCAAKDEALKSAKAFIDFQLGWVSNTELQRQIELALSPDCGRDYVHRSEVEKAWREAVNASTESQLVATQYQFKDEFNNLASTPITFIRMLSHRYEDERWAVRHATSCLNKNGEFEFEGSPSSRDENFFDRCRFGSFAEAVKAAQKWRQTVGCAS